VSITVSRYSWVPSTGDHFMHMWRHLQAATLICCCEKETFARFL